MIGTIRRELLDHRELYSTSGTFTGDSEHTWTTTIRARTHLSLDKDTHQVLESTEEPPTELAARARGTGDNGGTNGPRFAT